ncbi:hypothetical protein TrLO_g11291 [Triparma laevis f. longispina]|uniref:Uncharacterized protein n=1 Tax=Triparma laevis f. longispina TaxID=1714387 RepID=A0A9W6ZR64_9STRA|nr:hypothetical protein TrLO_g11291 [Triparma laevis f. longispina]
MSSSSAALPIVAASVVGALSLIYVVLSDVSVDLSICSILYSCCGLCCGELVEAAGSARFTLQRHLRGASVSLALALGELQP